MVEIMAGVPDLTSVGVGAVVTLPIRDWGTIGIRLEVQGVVYLIKPPILDAAAPGDSGQPGSAEGTETPVVTPPATGEAAPANKQLR